jgi:hypothetical protein
MQALKVAGEQLNTAECQACERVWNRGKLCYVGPVDPPQFHSFIRSLGPFLANVRVEVSLYPSVVAAEEHTRDG